MEEAVDALGTATRLDVGFADALAAVAVAGTQAGHRSGRVAIAILATQRVLRLHVPEERLALVADAALNPLLALAQFAFRHRSAAGELLHYAGRITVAVYVTVPTRGETPGSETKIVTVFSSYLRRLDSCRMTRGSGRIAGRQSCSCIGSCPRHHTTHPATRTCRSYSLSK